MRRILSIRVFAWAGVLAVIAGSPGLADEAKVTLLAEEGIVRPDAAEQIAVKDITPVNGTFLSYTGLMTTVIELKDGRFRFWFESDVKSPDDPVYPISGTYTTEGNLIRMEGLHPIMGEWRFRSVGGTPTLWRSDAKQIDYPFGLKTFLKYGIGSILVPASAGAEEAWRNRSAPVIDSSVTDPIRFSAPAAAPKE